MAENAYGHIESPAQKLVALPVSFAPSAGGPTGVFAPGLLSVTRQGVGLYRFAFKERYPKLVHFSGSFALLALAVRTPVLKNIVVGMGQANTIDVQFVDGAGAAVEVAADPANLFFCSFAFSNTVLPSL